MLTQSEMAAEMKLSRSVISDNCKAGAPLTSVEAFRHWRHCNVREKWNQKAYEATVKATPPDDICGDVGWEFVKEAWADFKNRKPKFDDSPDDLTPLALLVCWATAGMLAAGKTDEEDALANSAALVSSFDDNEARMTYAAIRAQYKN